MCHKLRNAVLAKKADVKNVATSITDNLILSLHSVFHIYTYICIWGIIAKCHETFFWGEGGGGGNGSTISPYIA